MPINALYLRAFHAVAREGSFTRAAEALHLTQPTLSGQVKELEAIYGVKLFERRGRGTELTELGRALYDLTSRHFTLLEEAEELLQSARELLRGNLRVFADAPYLLMPILAAFQKRYPGIRLDISFGNSRQVIASLGDRSADIGICPEVAQDPKLMRLAYRRDALVVFVNRAHPWAERSSVKLAEVAGQCIILREAGSVTRKLLEAALADAKLKLEEVMEISSREAVREAVAAGLGLGVVSDSEFLPDPRLHKLALERPQIGSTTYITCLKERRDTRVVKAFFDLASEMAER